MARQTDLNGIWMLTGEAPWEDGVPLGPIVYADGNMLIASIEAYKILEYKENCEKRGIETTPRMAALFDGLTEEDNPVLIRYKLKIDSELFQ